MTYDRSLCWVRRDLRIADHTALAQACGASRAVAVVFIFDTTILDRLEDRDDKRITFIHRSLMELDRKLREQGSMLLVRHGDPVKEIPRLMQELHADALFFNSDYEPSAKHRDACVKAELTKLGRQVHACKDQVIFHEDEIISGMKAPFRVYTSYRNAWHKRLRSGVDAISPSAEYIPDLRRLAPAAMLREHHVPWSLDALGFIESTLWLEPGETAARARLNEFVEHVSSYANQRDIPAVDGTSRLSVHLRFGTISIRELVRGAMEQKSSGAAKWLDELVWRDFYHMILDHFPHVVDKPFRPEYEQMHWPGHAAHFEAWCEGRTGYPIIDAAMRHFRATGWMHNRLRMIVASFLTKDLLVDYRFGEAWFARYLLDFDLASNNGNWQWSASTGCDAQPYFRIFNPITQSEKFDPEGTFIREHCPELRGFSSPDIHWPAGATISAQRTAGCIIGEDYPAPIVDHATQRAHALAMYKER